MTKKINSESSVTDILISCWSWYIKGNMKQRIIWLLYIFILTFEFFSTRTKYQFFPFLLLFFPILLLDKLLGKRKN